MSVTSTNLIQGPATVYVGAFGTAEPAIDEDPGAGWEDVGGTTDGVTLNIEDEYTELTVDQIIYEVGRRRTARVVTVATNLAEATLENLARAINNTAPTGGVLEADDGLAAFAPEYSAIMVEGIAPGGRRRRIILRKTLATESVETAYKKDEMTVVPVTWTLHWVSASVRPFRIQDEPETVEG